MEEQDHAPRQRDSNARGSVLDAVCRCNMISGNFPEGFLAPAWRLLDCQQILLPIFFFKHNFVHVLLLVGQGGVRIHAYPGGFPVDDTTPSCIHPDGHWLLYRVYSLFVCPNLLLQV